MSPIATQNLNFILPDLTRVYQSLPLGSYRQDIAYTGALKSLQALALGTYRHDIAYTGALKPILQALALGSYRHDIAYTGALKSVQALPKGSYRQDIAYTGALKSNILLLNLHEKTGVLSTAQTPVFRFKTSFDGSLAA